MVCQPARNLIQPRMGGCMNRRLAWPGSWGDWDGEIGMGISFQNILQDRMEWWWWWCCIKFQTFSFSCFQHPDPEVCPKRFPNWAWSWSFPFVHGPHGRVRAPFLLRTFRFAFAFASLRCQAAEAVGLCQVLSGHLVTSGPEDSEDQNSWYLKFMIFMIYDLCTFPPWYNSV